MNDFQAILKAEGGRKGGSSTSKAKQAAARLNGSRGGRPEGTKTRTFGEYLLRRKLTGAEREQARTAFFRLSNAGGARSEQSQFKRFFGIDPSTDYDFLKTTDYRARRPRPGTEMELIVARFRQAARWYLGTK